MVNLLLIESPGKIKKLSQILGSGWMIKASMGHVRELANDGEDALGFDLNGDQVICRYEPRGDRGKKVLKELQEAVRHCTQIYIATDADREGETIGWHLAQALKLKQPLRITYTEITKPALMSAIAKPHSLDQNLIAAGRARDCLDKLVGYKGSKHLVWALKNGAKSMGRVQSATLHLLCLREQEIFKFKPENYWSVWVDYQAGFRAFYRGNIKEVDHQITPDDADDHSDRQLPESERVHTQAEADRLVNIARSYPHQVVKLESKNTSQSPPPPFTTSTLQQAAGAKLRFSSEQTMKIAQSLYEAGYITYMRTDSVALSEQFCATVRQYLEQHDPDNIPVTVTQYRASKNAQEAHEAIRPTDIYRHPEQLQLADHENHLYQLIWNRTIASQCKPAQLAKTRIISQSESVFWEAKGQVLIFAGYTKYWHNISNDHVLPQVKINQTLTVKEANSEKKQTQPPPRYTEPKLVQLMERKGIGRPSTYSPTIKTLKEREYVQLIKSKLQPTQLGMELDRFLDQAIPDLIQADFTAQMETQLDAIASGNLNWEKYLTSWNRDYFTPAIGKAIAEIKHFQPHIKQQDCLPNQTESVKIQCPNCGKLMSKVFSKSPKLKADHFLKCHQENQGCGTVMFLNVKTKNYELPYVAPKITPEIKITKSELSTQLKCPICESILETHPYMKNGQSKIMLRCTNPKTRQTKCKEVAFFESKTGNWWSPKFGEMKKSQL